MPHAPTLSCGRRGGGSSVGRAPGCGPGGRGFESRSPPLYGFRAGASGEQGILTAAMRFPWNVFRVSSLLAVSVLAGYLWLDALEGRPRRRQPRVSAAVVLRAGRSAGHLRAGRDAAGEPSPARRGTERATAAGRAGAPCCRGSCAHRRANLDGNGLAAADGRRLTVEPVRHTYGCPDGRSHTRSEAGSEADAQAGSHAHANSHSYPGPRADARSRSDARWGRLEPWRARRPRVPRLPFRHR